MDNQIKQLLRGFVILGVLIAIAILIGMFFAFGGDNPLLIHVSNVIDMILVAITVLFAMAVVYKVYAWVSGTGDPITTSQKTKNRQKSANSDELPELTELIENLDSDN